MGLSNKKEEQLRAMPIVEAKIGRSKDGRFMVHKTIITHIKPVDYYKAVIDGPVEEKGSALTLTGIMNRNDNYDWLFVQVIAANGKDYWVGGNVDEDINPKIALDFYYPHLTTSPTPSSTATFTATLNYSPTPSRTPPFTTPTASP